MSIYLALIIPLLVSGISYFFYPKRITLWELFVPAAVGFLAILIVGAIVRQVGKSDTKYNGELITQVRYYEYWESWVHKICSYTTSDGKGHSTTHYYDCSYCDENPAHWTMVTASGEEHSISEGTYLRIKKQWENEHFQDLNRNITYHNGLFNKCGQDGDMYYSVWDKHIQHSYTRYEKSHFQNPIKHAHSAFQFEDISDTAAKHMGLFIYKPLNEADMTNQITVQGNIKDSVRKVLEYLNGHLGSKYGVHIQTLIFNQKDPKIAQKQEAYWSGGGPNDVTICLGASGDSITWCRVFSWCDNKELTVGIRDDIMEYPYLNPNHIYNCVRHNVSEYFTPKDFSAFEYLPYDYSGWNYFFVYFITLIASLASNWWCINNEFEN